MSTAQDSTFEGSVEVCCHHVNFHYDLEDLELTPELERALTEEAASRAKRRITDGCPEDELNCLWRGETEIRGWFKIDRT